MAKETDSGEEKTEAPSGKRRGEMRQKGMVAKSQEVSTVAVLVSGLIALSFFAPFLYHRISTMITDVYNKIKTPQMTDGDLLEFMSHMAIYYLLTIAPVVLIIMLAALVVNAIQVGGIKFAWQSIAPKFSNLNPISGFKKIMISPKSLVELLKSVIKLIIVGSVTYAVLINEIDTLNIISDLEISGIVLYILKIMFKIFIWASIAMVFLAILDYAYQKWDFEQNLKMTKTEIKEENKQYEGDPQIKRKIKSMQMEMAMRRMMQAVPKADVVVTNPVHLAVALGYDNKSMSAPRVLAKGSGLVAERIKKIAREHHIPIVENKELAQNLFKLVELGQEIPATLYQAVAEVLAYVYRLKKKY